MGIIKPAANAQYYSKKGQGVYGISSAEAAVSDSELSEIGSASDSSDHFEMSPRAKAVLVEVAKQFDEVLDQHPEYRHHFYKGESKGNGQFSALAFMAHFRSFLNNPHYQKLAEFDRDFGEFYSKIDAIGRMSQVALSQTQQRLREGDTATYSRLKKAK